MSKLVAVVGMGYVGFPLTLAFERVMPRLGFDVSEEKIQACREGYDPVAEGDEAPFVDVKSVFDRQILQDTGFEVWRL